MAYIFKKSEEANTYLYTKGKQFILDRKEYVGEYHLQGKIPYTDPIHKTTSKRLYPYDINPHVYNYTILRPDINYNQYTQPYACYVEPSQGNYNMGFFTRYFVKKRNEVSPPIYEIDQALLKLYGKVTGIDSNLYQKTEMRWDISLNEVTPERISKLNAANARLANQEMPGLFSHITNFFEFSALKRKVDLNP